MSDDNDSEFARQIPGVKRLRQDRINVYQQRPPRTHTFKPRAPEPETADRSPEPSSAAPAQAAFFNGGLQKKLQRKIRQGLIRPELSLDLHGCRQQEAQAMLQAFLTDAVQRRLRMLLIVHGQGFRSQQDAVLKPLVQRWLATRSEVLAWCPAQARDGAAGATYVYLRS